MCVIGRGSLGYVLIEENGQLGTILVGLNSGIPLCAFGFACNLREKLLAQC